MCQEKGAAPLRELPLNALICSGQAARSRPALCPLSENSSGCKFTLGGIRSQPALGWREAFRVSRPLLGEPSVGEEGPCTSQHLPKATKPLGNLWEGSQESTARQGLL